MTKRTKHNIEYTLSTLAVEGLKPSREAIQLCKEVSDKKISLDDAIYAIKVKYGVADEPRT